MVFFEFSEPLPQAQPSQSSTVAPSPIYPRLPEISTDDRKLHPELGRLFVHQFCIWVFRTYGCNKIYQNVVGGDRDAARFERLRKMLGGRSQGGGRNSPPANEIGVF